MFGDGSATWSCDLHNDKMKVEVTALGRLRPQTDISTGQTVLVIRKTEAAVFSEIQTIKVAK